MDIDNPDNNDEGGEDQQLVIEYEAYVGDGEPQPAARRSQSDEEADSEPEPRIDDADAASEDKQSQMMIDDATAEEPFNISSPASHSEEEWDQADAGALDEDFDITLPASHSYMDEPGSEMVPVGGRSVLEAGARARLPCMAHRGTVFPGDTVPLLLPDPQDAAVLAQIVHGDRLFALLSPNSDKDLNERHSRLSGFGVVCEVFEAAQTAPGEPSHAARALSRALHRCRLVAAPGAPASSADGGRARLLHFGRLRRAEVQVLAERPPRAPLAAHPPSRWVRAQDALVTPWPLFVYDLFDIDRMRETIKNYFQSLGLDTLLPEEPVQLSFWVARNMPLPARDQSALFSVDCAVTRLRMECALISRTAVVCCAGCRVALARRAHVLCMSASGPHGTFTNPHGRMHDVVTTRRAGNVRLASPRCADFSWFPGYYWSVLSCSRCMQHVGWRFDAISPTLRPRQFYALCRNYVPASAARFRTPLARGELVRIAPR